MPIRGDVGRFSRIKGLFMEARLFMMAAFALHSRLAIDETARGNTDQHEQ